MTSRLHITTSQRLRRLARWSAVCLAGALICAHGVAQPAEQEAVRDIELDPISFRGPDPAKRFTDIKIQQNLGAKLPMDLTFRNERGETVRLGDFFDGDRPVVLSMVYYGCPMLCTLVLNGMVTSFDGQPADFKLGPDYTVISVSIDPTEGPELAAEKKAAYLERLHIDGAADNWHFLTGDELAIETLAGVVGFRYYYDEPTGQYAHDSGVIIVTPHGQVSSYYLGIEYLPNNLRTALKVAATDTIGEYLQQPTLLCFAYDPTKGTYGLIILSALRLAGMGTVLLIVGFWVLQYLRHRRALETPASENRPRTPAPAGHSGSI